MGRVPLPELPPEIGIVLTTYSMREAKLQAQWVAVINCGSHLLICGSPSWKPGPIEGAMSLSLPASPAPAAAPYRFAPDPVTKNQTESSPQLAADVSVVFGPLFIISKFRMISLTLIPVMIY
jgi:hypothetical protein